MKFVLCILFAAVFATNAFSVRDNPAWNDLKVTFGLNVFDPNNFASLPRTQKAATDANWKMIDSHCSDSSQPFRGFRFWLKSDPAVILIFDKNGYIAGIQTAVDLSKVNYQPGPFRSQHPFILYNNMQTMTAYFVDPSTVCTGRTNSQFSSQGTGTGLWIQNGTNPITTSLNIAMQQSDLGSTKWTQGKCTWAMGMHYWYDVTKDMSCDRFFPAFLLYDESKLWGFGWAINAGLSSPRYEHPNADIAGNFINPEPDCFFTDPSFKQMSTMHVYFTKNPQNVFC